MAIIQYKSIIVSCISVSNQLALTWLQWHHLGMGGRPTQLMWHTSTQEWKDMCECECALKSAVVC